MATLLARSGRVRRITLIDNDAYEPRNITSQNIVARDVGRRKVDALARRVRAIAPDIEVVSIDATVEQVPLGRLRADVIVTTVDNLAPRRWCNRAARRLGIPLVDTGVRPEDLLVRIDVVGPAPTDACLECGWTPAEQATLSHSYPCRTSPAIAPTGAPAYLASVTAGLACAEIIKLADDDTRHSLTGRQVLLDLNTHRVYITKHHRAPDCRFDHRPWVIEALMQKPGAISLGRTLRSMTPVQGARLRVHGDAFVLRLVCPECQTTREKLHLAARLNDADRRCTACGARMVSAGIDTTDTLALSGLSAAQRRTSLYSIGLRSGDLFTVESDTGERHFEIGGQA